MARAKGLWGSPASSADEAEAPGALGAGIFDFEADVAQRKRKASGARLSEASGGRKAARRLALASSGAASSARELVEAAPPQFVELLAKQLGAKQQAQLSKKFGAGQGFLVQVPSSGMKKKERSRLDEWLAALGFSAGPTLGRGVVRISSLKADVIIRELLRRELPNVDKDDLQLPSAHRQAPVVDMSYADEGKENHAEDEAEMQVEVDMANDPTIQKLKEHFQKLDSLELEVVSFAEHNRLLSSARHVQIADAMEEVLAQPSERKERSRARRLSKLERISGRFSSLSRMSSIAPIIEDEEESGNEEESVEMAPVFLSPIKRTRASLAQAKKLSAKKKKPTKSVFADKTLRLVLRSGFISPKDIKSVLCRVSLSWRRIGIAYESTDLLLVYTAAVETDIAPCCFAVNRVYAWSVADYVNQRVGIRTMEEVYRQHPQGHYLADGAYKEVFKVISAENKRLEAVSVMDIAAIESTGNQIVVQQEIAHSVLLSHLVETGTCPNFLRIFDIYLAPEKPLEARWGSARRRKPAELLTDRLQNIQVSSGNDPKRNEVDEAKLYQYIDMEYCDGGDIEDFINLQNDKMLPAASVAVPFFFQMIFSLYSAREQLHLRHCDVKLLNFFLKGMRRKKHSNDTSGASKTVVHYWIEQECFELRLPVDFSYWVKLADYGSADSSYENIGKPVTLDQFTTLENTPIEFLLEGDAAQQSFASDTFSLGLSLFHLFTGCAPYEEILKSVACPAPLLRDLKALWTNPRKNSGFSVLRQVVLDDPEDTMYHTLYRFLVLFGMPSENPSEQTISKVWDVLCKHLRPELAPVRPQRSSRRLASSQGAETAGSDASSVKQQFKQDVEAFSLASGSNTTIKRGRERLQSVPGAFELLESLVAFSPSSRPTLKQVLHHRVFESLRGSNVAADFVVDCYKTDGSSLSVIRDV